jgi:hypothetical protein
MDEHVSDASGQAVIIPNSAAAAENHVSKSIWSYKHDFKFIIRLTFAIVHSVLLTIFHLALTLLFPTFSGLFFSLLGCVILPCISLALSFYINKFIAYIFSESLSIQKLLRVVWIPPLGIFILNLIILPLEIMNSYAIGPLQALAATSITFGFFLSFFLQMYAGMYILNSEDEPRD